MTKEELFESLGEIDPVSVQKAEEYRGRKKSFRRGWIAIAACAAILVGVIFGLPALKVGNREDRGADPGEGASIREDPKAPLTPEEDPKQTTSVDRIEGMKAVLAAYPDPVARSMGAFEYMASEEHREWWMAHLSAVEQSQALQPELYGYCTDIMRQLLTAKDDNTVCSPINTYVAFAMLAEVTDGNTRQQLLDMLGAPDIETLRATVASVWNSSYADTPTLKTVLANSLWLDSAVTCSDEVLNRLAEEYCASSFLGTPGSEEMDLALRAWTDDNTGGLLSDYTEKLSVAPDTVLELVSTIYLRAMWLSEFRTEDTEQATFHGTAGDTAVDMMKRTDVRCVCRTDTFTAIGLGLRDGGSMYFYLPAENTDVNALLSDPELMKPVRYAEDDPDMYTCEVHLSLPKFKVSCQTDLLAAAQALGITDVLDGSLADFSPLTSEAEGLCLTRASHAAMLEIDEEGVTGAAFTDIATGTGGIFPDEELELVFDRPFLFLVTGMDGTVLFSGIVRNVD